MKPSLQEQLAFLGRTINPDYIIVIQNKASENMDFSQFKKNELEVKEKKVREKRYNIDTIQWEEGKTKILVKDSWFSNRIVCDCTCSTDKLESNLDRLKRQYRSEVETI